MNFDLELWKTVAIFAGISFVPIWGWIYFFQKQNHEKKKYVIITFFAGMMSIIPIKLYEKYWDFAVWKLEHLNLFKYLDAVAGTQTVGAVLSFVLVCIIVSSVIFVFSAFIMFLLEIISRDNTMEVFRGKIAKISESPFLFMTIGAFAGIITALLSFYFPAVNFSLSVLTLPLSVSRFCCQCYATVFVKCNPLFSRSRKSGTLILMGS